MRAFLPGETDLKNALPPPIYIYGGNNETVEPTLKFLMKIEIILVVSIDIYNPSLPLPSNP